ncbi:hypothetical protein ABHQ57_02385 [Tenacibaculum sp. ZH5_bin.1]|nr:hypothetical protein [Tenacibaculum mesophilum]
MENKHLKETAMNLSPDTVDNPTTGGGNNTGGTGNDGGNTGGD